MSRGGKRQGAGRPPNPDKWDEFWIPIWLGRWLKQSPKVIEVLKRDEVQRQIEEIADERRNCNDPQRTL